MSNRLRSATSPYLLQHRDNPVDWQEWGEEAFAEARRRNVPVLLSVGYAACHWCHVMAHESFEDETVAAVLNARFVAVKVDREERPDIDAVYMSAMTATDRPRRLADDGASSPPTASRSSAAPTSPGTSSCSVLAGARRGLAHPRGRGPRVAVRTSPRALADALRAPTPYAVERRRSRPCGRPAGAPVRPRRRRVRRCAEVPAVDGARVPAASPRPYRDGRRPRTWPSRTLEAMARSGMYDQLAGGFARYAVDAGWVVPHFEKMLYDNALLLRAYTTWWKVTRDPLAARIVRETADFLLRDLGTERGGFASSLDADADGVEGLTYAWTRGQLREVLGDDEGTAAAELLGVTRDGDLRARRVDAAAARRTLRPRVVRRRPPAPARRSRAATAARPGRQGRHVVERSRHRRAVRRRRHVRPAGAGSRRPSGAPPTSSTCTSSTASCGGLRASERSARLGPSPTTTATSPRDCSCCTRPPASARWLDAARDILRAARDFAAEDGGFHDTAEHAEPLYLRPRSAADNAEPAGQSALAAALVTLGAVTGDAGSTGRRRPRHGRGPRTGRPRAALRGVVARRRRSTRRRSAPGRGRRVGSGRRGARAGGATLPQPRTRRRARRAGRTGHPTARRTPARGRQACGLRLPGDGLRAADDRPVRPGRAAAVTGVHTLLTSRTAQ